MLIILKVKLCDLSRVFQSVCFMVWEINKWGNKVFVTRLPLEVQLAKNIIHVSLNKYLDEVKI